LSAAEIKEVMIQFAQKSPLSFRSQLYRRGMCLLPGAKQQIPRATMARFGMTILYRFSNYSAPGKESLAPRGAQGFVVRFRETWMFFASFAAFAVRGFRATLPGRRPESSGLRPASRGTIYSGRQPGLKAADRIPMRKLLPWLLLIWIAVLPPLLPADTVIEEIIARINNQIITRAEYTRSKETLKQEAQQQDPANAAKIVEERDKDVLRDLIDQQLLLEKGKDLGITADTEVIKRLDQMRKEMHMDSMEDLEKAATSQGISYEDFKQNLKNQIITQQVISREVGSRVNVSHEELQQFYDEHKSQMEQPEQIRLSELLTTEKKDKAPPADEEQELAAARTKAEDLLAQIRKGAAFEDIAKKNSDGPTAAQGGDLGYFKRGTLAKELEDKTFAMKPGAVSEVIRTKQGFVILKVTEHQQAGVPPLSEIEGRVQEAITVQKMQPALRAYLQKLREDAYIKIADGYVDTGASPNQTAPVETTAKEAGAKELKKKKKKLGII
jgi:parvulin-like peptidyl-prolyl isomerase